MEAWTGWVNKRSAVGCSWGSFGKRRCGDLARVRELRKCLCGGRLLAGHLLPSLASLWTLCPRVVLFLCQACKTPRWALIWVLKGSPGKGGGRPLLLFLLIALPSGTLLLHFREDKVDRIFCFFCVVVTPHCEGWLQGRMVAHVFAVFVMVGFCHFPFSLITPLSSHGSCKNRGPMLIFPCGPNSLEWPGLDNYHPCPAVIFRFCSRCCLTPQASGWWSQKKLHS